MAARVVLLARHARCFMSSVLASAFFMSANAAMPGNPAQPPAPGLTRAPEAASSVKFVMQTAVHGLDHPWGLQFLHDGRMLVSERAGQIRIVAKDGTLS